MDGGGKEGGWVAADARATTGARRREAATEKGGDDALTRSRSAGLKCTIMWYGVESAAGLIESSSFGVSPPPTPQGLRCCILLEGAMVGGEGGWVAADARATTGARRREAATERGGDDALTRSRSAGLRDLPG